MSNAVDSQMAEPAASGGLSSSALDYRGDGPPAFRFSWLSFDVSSMLPEGWYEELTGIARRDRVTKQLRPPHSTSREAADVASLTIMTVRGVTMWERVPWLIDLYRGRFTEMYYEAMGSKIYPTEDRRYAVVMNVQEGTDRYECHVDTNPVEALLYVTDHPRGSGGELVVANNAAATSVEEVDADCTTVHPVSGHVVFFDARHHPHYVRPMKRPGLRVAVGMNYYTDDCPEETRPQDLNDYLYGPVGTPVQ